MTRLRDHWTAPVPADVARVINEPSRRWAGLLAATVGFFALTWFALYEGAYLALGIYCTCAVFAFIPGMLHRVGSFVVFTAFAVACIGGNWMTAVMITAISVMRYASAYLAIRGDARARAAYDEYVGNTPRDGAL